jgi:hypothetical protein
MKTITLECYVCGEQFERLLKQYKYDAKQRADKEYHPLCSLECKKQFGSTSTRVECENCGGSFEKRASQIEKTDHNFCGSSCAAQFNNKHRKIWSKTKEVNCKYCFTAMTVNVGSAKKLCDACKRTRAHISGVDRKPRQPKLQYGTCQICGDLFSQNNLGKLRKTCSKKCSSVLMSNVAIDRTQSNFSGLKSIVCWYNFRGKKILCASKAEYSCLDYIEKNYSVLDIDRSTLILAYELDNKKRKYNPDFWVKLDDGSVLVVECKTQLSNKYLQRKWDIYYRSIPLKQEALKAYCEDNGHRILWYSKDMNSKFYASLSKDYLVKIGAFVQK